MEKRELKEEVICFDISDFYDQDMERIKIKKMPFVVDTQK